MSDAARNGCAQGFGWGCGIIIGIVVAVNLIWIIPMLGLFGAAAVGSALVATDSATYTDESPSFAKGTPRAHHPGEPIRIDRIPSGTAEVTLDSLRIGKASLEEFNDSWESEDLYVIARFKVRNLGTDPIQLHLSPASCIDLCAGSFDGPLLASMDTECINAVDAHPGKTTLKCNEELVFDTFFTAPLNPSTLHLEVDARLFGGSKVLDFESDGLVSPPSGDSK